MAIIDNKIRDEKLLYNTNREAAQISALSSGKINEYEHLTGILSEILPSNQRQIIEQAKLAYYPLGKAFQKQKEKKIGAIKSLDPSNKLKTIEGIFPQSLMNYLIRAKLKEIIELQADKFIVNRLFVLPFENETQQTSYKQYYLPTTEMKNQNVIIDGQNFFDQPITKNLMT